MNNEWYRIRLAFCFMTVLLIFVGILFRIIQLQILPSEQLEALSKRQFRQIVKKSNVRHPIFDRNYEELAVSVPAGSIYARPKQIRQRIKVARALGRTLDGTLEKWLKKISQKKSFVWIQRQVSAEKAKQIAALKLPGIFVESESRRLYPNGALASHILGFTDVDGRGISGAELKANSGLTDDEDTSLIYKDGRGNASYIVKEMSEKENQISGIALTIDRRIQSALEEELSTALSETGAKSVMAVVMDPFTGEIYAMGQTPGFDPNHFKSAPSHLFTNQLISSLFEPGSTVKPLVAAAALQEGQFKASSIIDCGNGKMTFGKDTIGEAESHHRFGSIPLERVVHVSSNIGAARLGLALGVDRVRGVFDRFGLLTKTGIQLPGETTGYLRPESDWVPILVATASFGQGVAVTPLQMVSAYAPFANGGFLVRPKIFVGEVSATESERDPGRRILSPKIAQEMTKILTGVTEAKGATGLNAKISGIRVAGKTGTAQKYIPGTGYDSKKYFSSFIGYLPADHPQLLIGVMVDEPKFPYVASQMAAPYFRRIAERSLQLLDKNPRQTLAKFSVPTEMKVPTEENPETPLENTLPATSKGWILPDLKGRTMKEVFTILDTLDTKSPVNVKYLGTGFLEKQEPGGGTEISGNRQVTLYFSPWIEP